MTVIDQVWEGLLVKILLKNNCIFIQKIAQSEAYVGTPQVTPGFSPGGCGAGEVVGDVECGSEGRQIED